MLKKIHVISLGFLLVALLILGLQIWHPWERQPVVFYEPLILPVETIEGDIIVLSNGSYITIDRNRRINSIEYNNGRVTINSTKYVSLWELLTNSE